MKIVVLVNKDRYVDIWGKSVAEQINVKIFHGGVNTVLMIIYCSDVKPVSSYVKEIVEHNKKKYGVDNNVVKAYNIVTMDFANIIKE